MVEKNAAYWSQELKRRLDRIETPVPTPRFAEADDTLLYKAVVSNEGVDKEIAWNMSKCEAGLLISNLTQKMRTKNVGTDGEAYFELVPVYRIEKQKEAV